MILDYATLHDYYCHTHKYLMFILVLFTFCTLKEKIYPLFVYFNVWN